MNGWTNKQTSDFVSAVAGHRIPWRMVKEFIKLNPELTGKMLSQWADDNLPDTEPYNSLSWLYIDWEQVAEEWKIFQ